MSTANPPLLDPYRDWLSLPPGPRPPDHYTLLRLPRLESNPEKIREAARAQMKQVRPRCLKHPELGTRLLNEIAAAQVCLLDPERAAQYNRYLEGGADTTAGQMMVPQVTEGEIYKVLWEEDDRPLTPEAAEATVQEVRKPKVRRRRVAREEEEEPEPSGRLWLVAGASFVGVLFVAVAALGVWTSLRGGKAKSPPVAEAESPVEPPPAERPVQPVAQEPEPRADKPADAPGEPMPPGKQQPLPPDVKPDPPPEQPRPAPPQKERPVQELPKVGRRDPPPEEPKEKPAGPVLVKELRCLKGHPDEVHAVAFFPDGKRLASGGADSLIRIWDTQTGQQAGVLAWCKDHKGIQCLAVSADGTHLFAGTLAGHAHLGQVGVVNGRVEGKLHWDRFANDTVTSAGFFGKDIWAFFLAGDTQMLMGPKNLTVPLRVNERMRGWTQMATSRDGQWVLMGGDRVLSLYNLKSSRKLAQLPDPAGKILSLALSADGQIGVSSSDDGAVCVWELNSATAVRLLTGHTRPAAAVALSPDGRHAVTVGQDNTVRLWEVSTGRELGQLAGHQQMATCVAFSPDGGQVATGGLDKTVRLWDIPAEGRTANRPPEVPDPVAARVPMGVDAPPARFAYPPAPSSLNAYRGKVGESFTFEVTGTTTGTVWGTGVYTDDSDLATAAVHAGVLGDGQRGLVKVTILRGQRRYPGSTRHRVTSNPYENWDGSYRVELVRALGPPGGGENNAPLDPGKRRR